ncbi:MAG: multicopper oxidase domain-containing protein [Streptosporangiales bacterium]|nr:multicopper oxidase domain-containing protein [Streptosporangiales bacterium]
MSLLKRVLIVSGSITAAAVLAIAAAGVWLWNDATVNTAGAEPFRTELAIPPLAKSRVGPDGTRVFDLRMRAGSREFLPGRQTPTWGFNGDHLGPTLRAKRGEKVRVRVRNGLPEPSTVHWHGMHLPARMDGGPHQMVPPGGTWTPHWTVDQPATTLWYHPHPHGATEKHVRRGLAGMFILDDDAASRLPLPDRYGVDDLPVIVQDVRFDGANLAEDRSLIESVGFLGDRTMVNGTLSPYREVRDEAVRLRLLNASAARTYAFGFPGDRSFALIGTDGGLLERPVPMRRIQLSPGERAEIVVRMNPGETTVLRSFPQDYGDAFQQRLNGGADTLDVLQLRAARTLRPSPGLPEALADQETPDGSDAVRTRRFELVMPMINGRSMDMRRVDAAVTRGTTEIWTVTNADGMPHNFHVHDVQFRILDVDGRRPPAHLRGPKDTVFLPSGSTARLALRFDGPADPKVPYMYHCHLLYHEDSGMMGQFTVVEKGQRPSAPPVARGHH